MDTDTTITKSTSWQMFDDISPRYDFLNHLLSFGLDIHWRRQISRFLPNKTNQKVLDLATGTGDVLISLLNNNANVQSGIGLDLAGKMMHIGRHKIKQSKFETRITLKHGDAHHVPFDTNTFDVSTIAFGIRNMNDPGRVLREMHRVLNEGGKALILEFSLPANPLIRAGHIFYLRTIVPLIGALFSGHYRAYRYLNQTIESFPYGERFCQMMDNAGFKNVKAHSLLFGVATIYSGDKK